MAARTAGAGEAHAASRTARLTVAAVALLALSALLHSLAQARLAAWLAVPLVIGVCWWLVHSSMQVLPLYLPPVLVPAFLAWIFGQTLLPGRTPLIEQLVHVLHGPAERVLDAVAGSLVTLLPAGGPARGVRTRGLRYPLVGEVLHAGTTRGVSNVVDGAPAAVALDEGALLVIVQGGT